MCVQSAFCIGVDVEFNLAYTTVELLGQRLMLIVEPLVCVRILSLPKLTFAGSDAGVVAVVRSYYLNLIEFNVAIIFRCLRTCLKRNERCRNNNEGQNAIANLRHVYPFRPNFCGENVVIGWWVVVNYVVRYGLL